MRWSGAWLLSAASVCACGGTGAPPGGGAGSGAAFAGGSAGASGGASGASAAGGGGAPAGGSAGSAAGGSSGAAPAAACEGTFGTPSVIFELPGQSIGSLSLGPGELELIFVTSPLDAEPLEEPQTYRRGLRASTSAPFTEGEALPQLDAACGEPTLLRSGDLSLDGLRYYFVCYSSIEMLETPLHLATRASLDAPFVVQPETYGDVYAGPTLSPDELELLTSPSTSGDTPSLRYRRPDRSAAFELASSEPTGVVFRTPELSPDGLFVFGATRPDSTPTAIVMAERDAGGTLFGNPSTLAQAAEVSDALGSAAISGDCRSLYYVEIDMDNTVSPRTETDRVYVMRR